MARDFRPLGSPADFPADPQGIQDHGQDLVDTAALIEEQVALLRRLGERDSWTTDTADAFRDRAQDLAGRIDRARGRYRDVGRRLKDLAVDLEETERQAQLKADSAEVFADVLRRTPPAAPEVPPEGGEPVMTPEGERRNRLREQAQDQYDEQARLYRRLVEQAREQADDAARAIRGELDDDVKDDWWDRNAGWIKVAGQVLGAIAAIAGIVLLFVATGGLVFFIALGVALVAGALALAASLGLALEADGSWTQVALDALGLVTLGVGGAAIGALARGFPAVRAVVASTRAAAAWSGSMNRLFGIPRALATWRASLPFSFGGLRASGVHALRQLSDEAAAASRAARDATLAPFPVTRLQRFVDGGLDTAQMVRQSREMLESLRHLDDVHVPAGLADDLASLVRLGRIGVPATNVGAIADIGQFMAELPSLDITNGTKILTDVIGRLR